MNSYETIPEIVPENGPDGGARPPRENWGVGVLERGLSVNLGDLGGRRGFVANARVRVTEADGTSWTGLTALD